MLTGGCTAATNAAKTLHLLMIVVAYPVPRPVVGSAADAAALKQVRHPGTAPWICTPAASARDPAVSAADERPTLFRPT